MRSNRRSGGFGTSALVGLVVLAGGLFALTRIYPQHAVAFWGVGLAMLLVCLAIAVRRAMRGGKPGGAGG